MSEWQGMRKQLNTRLRDLLKTGRKRLAKLKKMLDTLTRQRNVLFELCKNKYNAYIDKSNVISML